MVVLTTGRCSIEVTGHLSATQMHDGGWVVEVPITGAQIISYTVSSGTAGLVMNVAGSDTMDPPPALPGQPQLPMLYARQPTMPVTVYPTDTAIVCAGSIGSATAFGARGPYTWGTVINSNYPANDGRSAVAEMMPVVFTSWAADALLHFRPPAIGSNAVARYFRDKPILFSDIQTARLQQVVDVDAMPIVWATWGHGKPTLELMQKMFARFCGDIYSGWRTDTGTPDMQHPGYAREVANAVSVASIMLNNLDTAVNKLPLLQSMIQWGLDLAGAFADGRSHLTPGQETIWNGHSQGRKALVIIAGHFLDIQAFRDPTGLLGTARFVEDNTYHWMPPITGPSAFAGPSTGETFDPTLGWHAIWRGGEATTGKMSNGLLWQVLPHDPVYTIPEGGQPWGDIEDHGSMAFAIHGYMGHACAAQIGTALSMRLWDLVPFMGTAFDKMIEQYMDGPGVGTILDEELAKVAVVVPWGTDWTIPSIPGGASGGYAQEFSATAWNLYA